MKLFLDSAHLPHIREIAEWGILDGITTNPSLIAKEFAEPVTKAELMQTFEQSVKEACKLVPNVSAQITATEYDEMITQAKLYSSWHKNVVVKVPMTKEGIKVLKYCADHKIRTNVTLVFTLQQAVAAAKAGATIISPFVGRLDDDGRDGMGLIADIMEAWHHYGFTTEVLVASVRSQEHIATAMVLGAHIATIPYKLFTTLLNDHLTDKGLEKFLADFASASKD